MTTTHKLPICERLQSIPVDPDDASQAAEIIVALYGALSGAVKNSDKQQRHGSYRIKPVQKLYDNAVAALNKASQ